MSDEWFSVGTFPEYNDDAWAEQKRWADVAEDVALYPEMNVRVVKTDDKGGVRVEVSEELYSFFKGRPM
ncbi:hypothetical protein [Desulfovibrio ferrophilus]|uniref:Uncharacterized protein n=1 Tax=Desulfovibrio ferrophilus TaxID=241368 RepID=A0A2Z6AW24_9BACT|nr:hypothetical protein [Desulfovibrio ferrophilus]BBD07418.1 uncharacterized protein DFE_0692 [Desulfovibrio ferrophilus]